MALICLLAVPAAAQNSDTALAAERLEASYNSGAAFIKSAPLDDYLAQIVHRLQAADPEARARPLRIHCLKDDLPYAFILENGAGYLTTGLIERLDDESQLAGMLSLAIAPWVRHDQDALDAKGRRRGMRNYLPNLLLITVTAGLGAIAMAKAETREQLDQARQLRRASDAVALQWLANAGYAPAAAEAALRRLHDTLLAEKRAGTHVLGDPVQLAQRADELAQLASVPTGPVAISAVDVNGAFARYAAYYALNQAAADVEAHPESVVAILDRVDGHQGQSAFSAYVRAELARRDIRSNADADIAIAAYERAIALRGVPVAAYRELGFLYRRRGDLARWRDAFRLYIERAPGADDAPIIRSYLEEPQ